MFSRLLQVLLLAGACFATTVQWHVVLNLNEDDKLWCYSCSGAACAEKTSVEQKRLLCNKRTHLCWAGYVGERAHRTCANRYCTPNDFSMESNVRIETCCRTDLCNAVVLSEGSTDPTVFAKRYNATTTTTNTPDYFIDEIEDGQAPTSLFNEPGSDEEEAASLSKPSGNAFPHGRHAPDSKHFNKGVALIGNLVLFLVPLLLVLLL